MFNRKSIPKYLTGVTVGEFAPYYRVRIKFTKNLKLIVDREHSKS